MLAPALDANAHLWDVGTGKDVLLAGHTHDLASARFSRDGRQVVTASLDGTARVWDFEPEAEVGPILKGHGAPLHLARFSPDGRRIVTARGQLLGKTDVSRNDRAARLWDAKTAQQTAVLVGHESMKDAPMRWEMLGEVVTACFSPDGSRLLTVSKDHDGRSGKEGSVPPFSPVRLWDVSTGKELLAVTGIDYRAQGAAFSPDGKRFLIVPHSGKPTVKGPGAWSEGGNHGGRIQVRDTFTGKLLAEVGPKGGWLSDAVWQPDGKLVHAFFSVGSTAWQVWEVESGKMIAERTEPGRPASVMVLGVNQHRSGVISADGSRMLGFVRAHRPDRDYAWLAEPRTGKRIAVLKGHDHEVTSAAFSPDGPWCVTASKDGTARVWSAEDGSERLVLRGHEGTVHAVAVSGDGKWIATAGEDRTARIWHADTGKEWLTLRGHQGAVYSVAFSPDGERALTASQDGTARLWPIDPLPLAQRRRPRELTEEECRLFDVRPLR
jgi:WD40 repeat protein